MKLVMSAGNYLSYLILRGLILRGLDTLSSVFGICFLIIYFPLEGSIYWKLEIAVTVRARE